MPGSRGDALATRLHCLASMNHMLTVRRKARALASLVAATLLSYLEIVGLVIRERLWRMPPRHRRVAEVFASAASRSTP